MVPEDSLIWYQTGDNEVPGKNCTNGTDETRGPI